ncbi:MAG: hypothetical protein IT462_05650 [Planctomycetes bacterium]|nr:hypothetical protein [Planctomycetota bacterium]
MKKVFKLVVWFFALVGVLASAGVGYVVGTNSELAQQFWAAKDDFREVPVDRRKEVFAELPARIKFEREVREDLSVLPAERQAALYEQLGKGRDASFESFKQRIAAEAKIVREAKDKEDAAKKLKELPTVNVKVNLTDTAPVAKPDPLLNVHNAQKDVDKARAAYSNEKRSGNDPKKLVSAAVSILKSLDKLGDNVQAARKLALDSESKSDLVDICENARELFKITKETPGIDSDGSASPYLKSVGPKLAAE